MKFIRIYERKNRFEENIILSKIVDVRNLTGKEYDSLKEYMDEANSKQVNDAIYIDGAYSYDVNNEKEFLEDMPLPDGTIVGAKEFTEHGSYIVLLGDVSNVYEVKVGVLV